VTEVIGLDEVYCELTGLPAPHASMRLLASEIDRGTGLECSIGIGPNKLVAKVASDADKPRGFVVLTREQAIERFADAPPGLIPGIGPRTVERLDALGIKTIRALAGADDERLAERLGGRGAAGLKRLARFEHDGEVTQERKVVSESREITFDYDISDHGELERRLAGLVSELCETLERQGRHGRTIAVKVRLDDFSTHTRARTLSDPVSSAHRIEPIALALLRRFAAPRPVRLIGVRVAGLESSAVEEPQLTLAL
jgi:DNA polymerase-4